MFDIFLIILSPILIYLTNSFFLKKKLIPNFSGSKHQRFFNSKNVPLSGGVFLFIISSFIFINEPIVLKSCILLIFLIGFFSDINFLSSVKLRFFFQSIIIFYFIFYTQSNIQSVRINFIDIYLQNFWISCLFTSFCLMILINGTNFIDGLNGLVISYFLVILFILFRIDLINLFFFNNLNLILFIVIFISLLFLNFYNKLYMGDSGSYLIGFLIGYFLISVYLIHSLISPYFIALLLWYPAYEILFSIVRKIKTNKSPFKPDNNHLHHLLFFYIEKKFAIKKNISNNISSIIIIFYNFIIFNISIINIYFSYYQIVLIIFNIIVYSITYSKLLQYKKN